MNHSRSHINTSETKLYWFYYWLKKQKYCNKGVSVQVFQNIKINYRR